MIVRPKVRGFICTTAHPIGCAWEVARQARLAEHRERTIDGPANALVIGSSMGYGLSTRIAAAFGYRAATVGVQLEREAAEGRTATAGWYNTAAFHREAADVGLYAKTFNADAFRESTKAAVVDLVLRDLGQLDLVVYSLAAPRRTLPSGRIAKSVIRPIDMTYRNKTIDVMSGEVSEVEIPAVESEDEITDTIEVMGGGDWQRWIDVLGEAGALAPHATTVAYSYIGPELTFPVYRHGTIGRAKDHLEATARLLDDRLRGGKGRAFVSVNKAVVTQSSSAIPAVPLYISLLFSVMRTKGLHEGCIEQAIRLFHERLYTTPTPIDESGRIRLDDWEMRADVQAEVMERWRQVSTDNVTELGDLDGYRREFLRLFGFEMDGVDYELDVEPDAVVDGLVQI